MGQHAREVGDARERSPVDVILASTSPRRAALLEQLGIRFEIVAPRVDEMWLPDEEPMHYACRVAGEKARAVAHSAGEVVVVAADTVVVCGGRVLGKPDSRKEGLAMLALLSGREHRVITAVTVARGGQFRSGATETLVHFRPLTREEREQYWESGEPSDKAGAYGIQGLGAIFVTSISGSYSGVVGLPLSLTAQLLREFGIDCLKGGRGAGPNLAEGAD